MFTHQGIWRGIDRLASSLGYSPSGLAKKAGLDPTSFNKSKRMSPDGKPRWPSTESISKILAVTDCTMSDFISLVGDDANDNVRDHLPGIPVIGFAQAGEGGYFDEDGYPAGDSWNDIPLPALGPGRDDSVYALEVSGNSMEPLYRDGDLLIVSPTSRIRKKDRIIIKTKDGEVMAKELVRKTTAKITLKSLNDKYEDLNFNASDIDWMARILWVSQ